MVIDIADINYKNKTRIHDTRPTYFINPAHEGKTFEKLTRFRKHSQNPLSGIEVLNEKKFSLADSERNLNKFLLNVIVVEDDLLNEQTLSPKKVRGLEPISKKRNNTMPRTIDFESSLENLKSTEGRTQEEDKVK